MSEVLGLLGLGLLADLVSAFDRRFSSRETPLGDDDVDQSWTTSPSAEPIARGLELLTRSEPRAAMQAFQSAIELDATSEEAHLGLACALDAMGNPQAAAERLAPWARRDDADPAVAFALGYCRERAGQIDDALMDYGRTIQQCPQLCNAHERLAAMHLTRGEYAAAMRRCDAIYQGDPQRTEIRRCLGGLSLLAGRPGDAVEHFEMALTIEPDNWALRNEQVIALQEAGDYRQAIEILEAQAESQPGFADTYMYLGDLYGCVSRHDEAIDNYVRAIELHPDYLEASSKLGAALLRVGRCEQAARWFAHAVEINDRLLDTYTGLALARKDLGNEHEAASAMRMAAGIEPNSPLLFSEVIRLRGASCADRSHKHEGGSASAEGSTFRSARSADDWLTKEIQAYQRHLRQRSNHTQWHYELGLLLRQRGELDEAIAHYRQALLINPAYTKAWVQLALILHQQGRSAEAFEAVDCGSNPGTELIWLHYQLSLSFTLPMRFDLSLEAVEQSRDTVAPNADTQANIRLALETVGLLDPIGVGPMGAETT